MASSHFVIFVVLIAAASAEITRFHSCHNVTAEHCTVSEVRINPCRVNKHCIFTKGTNASLSFDFTPNFATPKLKTGVYWPSPAGKDVAFADMETDDGCTLTTCPTTAGVPQTLHYNLYIGKKLPKGKFQFKWIVWNEDNTDQKCCFQTLIELKK